MEVTPSCYTVMKTHVLFSISYSLHLPLTNFGLNVVVFFSAENPEEVQENQVTYTEVILSNRLQKPVKSERGTFSFIKICGWGLGCGP